jgi:uncharacterized protein YjbI with pentapeptide repeats
MGDERRSAVRGRGRRIGAAMCMAAIGISSVLPADSATAATSPQTSPPATSAVVTTTQELVSRIGTGGVIDVAAGEYVITKALEFKKSSTQVRAVTPGTVTIRYQGTNGRVIDVLTTNVVLDGLVLTGARNSGDGGGVRIASGASATIQRSWITDNRSANGAGVFNRGTLSLTDSTISANSASSSGGAIVNAGTATIRNATLDGNSAKRGSAIVSSSTTTVSHSTIVRNVSGSNPWATLERSNGSLEIRWSILGENRRATGAAAKECEGTVTLRDVNLVGSANGCTTTGTVLTGGPLVGPLQDNGGPTPTAAPLDGSKAVDAISLNTSGACASGVTADQRGVTRPAGPRCDLGALEVAALSVVADLSVDTTNYIDRGLDPGTVEVGVTSVPTSAIASQLAADTPINADGTVDTTQAAGVRAASLRRIATLEELTGASPKAASLRRINLDSISLRRIALRDASLRRIALESISLRRIGGLGSIPLSQIPLLETGGWTELLQGTAFEGLPLQSITLEQIAGVVPEDFTLASIDLSSTSLRRISLPSALLSGATLGDIPLTGTDPDPASWCALLFGEECDPDLVAEVAESELWEAQLAGADVDQSAVLDVPLSGLTAASLRRISLRRIALQDIYIENSSLANISLRRISLRRIGDLGIEDLLVGCGESGLEGPCAPNSTLTLGDIARECTTSPSACKFREDADVGLLLDLLGVEFEGVSLLEGLSLLDIVLAFTAPEDVPWQSVDLEGARFQNLADPPQPTFDYVTEITIEQGPADVEVVLTLPAGFLPAGRADDPKPTWCPAATSCTDVEAAANSAVPTFRISAVSSGTYELRVPVRAGLRTGDFEATATVTAVGPNGAPSLITDPALVTVVQDSSSGAKAPVLNDQNLQLGYIGGSGELDVYSFKAPAGSTGGSARILLSNIPEGADYDLTVYGPRPASLRGEPVRELTGLGDIRFDLNPEDDVLPTDVVNDIVIDIATVASRVPALSDNSNYALRDISSRRANNDEEVTIPALVDGTTYVVVVSGYFGSISSDPYALRVRLDRRNALPACAAAPFAYPGPTPPRAVPTELGLAVEPGINTLYVTSAARLDAETSGRASDIISSIAGTEGVNGVDAGLLLVDGLPQWTGWNDNRCSPEARNAVAVEIGKAIDAANTTAEGSIDHIVIVGGDGVIPMAAVPDITLYSNESTFARSVLTGGRTNSVSGTIGAGFLLSDDPYATDAGISVLEGDHELYVPDRAIGRLVETADEILLQLDNFATFDGQLDPATFTNDALVTGYDFLTDGADAIISALSGPFETSSLNDDVWDRDDFLAKYDGTDFMVHSPNAHYDFESLLPARADRAGSYTEADLVTTDDFVGENPRAVAPAAALGFTVGCHAGLSVSDVQLGLPVRDWAQLAAGNGSQWIGHTTYGYGDTEIVAYSERLAALFAGNVAAHVQGSGPATLGAAVRDAKQAYLAGTLVLTPYDEKILQSWTYYGLPMYRLGNEVPVIPAGADDPADETTQLPETGPGPEEPTDPQTQPMGLVGVTSVGPATFGNPLSDGRRIVTIDVTNRLREVDVGDDGSYFAVDGNTTQAQYRPVQPAIDVEIPSAGRGAFGGFLITGLSSRDLGADHEPFFLRPIVDNSIDEERIVVEDGAFPATLQRVADLGGGQRLLLAAGQYQGGQRLFERISGELLPRPAGSTDTDAPRFIDVDGTNIPDVGTGRGIRFDVSTDGDATRVVIVFREEGQRNWRSIGLARRSSIGGVDTWFGSAPLVSSDAGTRAEFFVQAADAAGNVGITSNKIENFFAVDDVPGEGGEVPSIAAGEENQFDGRFFGDFSSFTVTPATATVSIDGLTAFELTDETITLAFVEGAQPSYEDGVLSLDRGNHTITALNDGIQVSRFFIFDPDSPVVEFSRDTTDWTNQPVSLFATANDGAGAGVASLCIGPPGATDPVCAPPDAGDDGLVQAGPLLIDAPDGDAVVQLVNATAMDRVGNERIQSTTVRIDRAAPTVTFTPMDDTYRRGEVSVSIDVADVGSGIAEVLVNGVPVLVPAGSTSFRTSETVTVPVGTAGDVSIEVSVTDAAGNETTESAIFRIDNAPPVVTLTPPPGDGWSADNIDVTVLATDVGSGLAELCVDGLCDEVAERSVTVWAPVGGINTQTITAAATDRVGNGSVPVSGAYRVDKAAPTVTVTPATADWTNGPVVVTVTAADEGSGLESVCLDTGGGCGTILLDADGTFTTTIDVDGVTTVTARATDNVGNITTTDPVEIKIDRDGPVLSIDPNDTTFRRGPVTVIVEASDARSGLASVCVAIGDGDCLLVTLDAAGRYATEVDLEGAGTRTLRAEATDRAGNRTVKETNQSIDNARPEVTFTPPPGDGWSAADIAVTITATDVGSGVAESCVDGSCNSETSRTVTVSAAAGNVTTQTINASATDRAGNESGPVSGTYRVDKAAPTVTATPATTNWTNGPVDVTVTAADVGSGLQSVCLDTGEGCTLVTLDAAGTFITTIDADGVTTITATATDNVGNTTTTAPVQVRIDRVPPTVNVTPDTAGWRNTDVTLTVTATDAASGVASISTTTCVGSVCSDPVETLTATATVSVTVPAGTARTTTVDVLVTDTAGNQSSVTRTVRIDKVDPTATLSITPAAGGGSNYNFGEVVTATFSCADVGAGLASCQLFDGTTVLATATPTNGGSASGSAVIPTTTSGQRTLTVLATDLAGNTFTTAPQTITVGLRFCLNYNPTTPNKVGSAVTVSVRPCDAAGVTLRLPALTLTALTVDRKLDPGPGAPGGSNPTYTFRFDGVSTYTYTIKTDGFPAGDRVLYFTTAPVPNRSSLSLAQLNAFPANEAPFRLRR